MDLILKENETIENTIIKLERSFDNLSDVAPIAYWYSTFTDEGKLKKLFFSDQIRKMLGYTSVNEFENTITSFRAHVHEEDAEYALGNIIGFATERVPSLNIDYRVLGASGRYVWCHTTGQLIRNHAGRALGMYGAFFDITPQMDLQKKLNDEHQLESVINAFTKDYEAAFIRSLDDDSFKVLANKNDIAHIISKFKTFSEAMRFYTENYVNPDDVAKFDAELFEISSTREHLAIGQSYSFEFRSQTTGEFLWCRITFNRISDNDVLIGFLNCNKDVLQRLVTEKLMNDYDALFVCDLNKDSLIAVRSSRVSSIGVMKEKKPYSETVKAFAEVVNEKYKQDWLNFADVEYVKKYIGKEAYREYVYELPHADKKMRRFAIDVIERINGEASLILASFIGIDDSRAQTILLHRKMAEQKKILDYFVEAYSSAYTVDLINNSFEILHMRHDFSEVFKMDGGMDDMINFIKVHVHPEDQTLILKIISNNYVPNRLKTENSFTFVIREIFEKEQRTMRGLIIKGTDEYHIAVGFLDISDEIEKERLNQKRLEEALAMAQSANRAKTTFLNNMSHDIRTPMNAIIGFTNLAASHIDNKAQVQEFLKKIQQSSNHLLSLINDVLDMSRIESGKMNIDEKPENISEIIHVLKDIVQTDAHSKQLNFFIDAIDVNDENIICDKLRLNQVLLNVLSNAIKYTAPGGTIIMHVTEKIIEDSELGEYEFVVKDNGMGMSNEFLDHIFEPFERVKSSTTSGIQGTGLGMAITKSIVDMMGGAIQINSTLDVGTTVTLTFKFKLQGKHQLPERLEEYIGTKALVIDDDSSTCLSICNMLEDAGIDSEWCTTGKEALIRALAAHKKNEPFKVYFIDWLMPDMNGVETTRRIRREVGNDAQIYILTAYDWADIEEDAYASGVNGFISKPMFPSDLRNVLRSSLDNSFKEEDSKKLTFEGKKILLVEDNEFNREIAKDLLEDAGFIVSTAVDGSYAVDILKNANPDDFDLVLMDVQMPIMDGYTATKAIRKLDSKISQIPILAMTANAFEEDRIQALEAGMNEHIVKPIDVQNLKETLAKFVK